MDLLTTVVLGGFTAYRVTHLIVHDTVLDPLRNRLHAWHMNGVGPGRSNRARTFLRDLLSCTYCAGFWVSLLTVLVFLLTGDVQPWDGWRQFLYFGMATFAVAGVQALLNRWDDSRNPGTQEG